MQFSYYIYMCLGIGAALIVCFKLLRRYVRGGQYTENTSISNKIVIITGGNAGIGKANAIDLAKRGGKIYIACRDKIRGEKALNDIRKESGSEKIYFLQLDLASLKSIREFSDKFHKLETKLDILINNAGLLAGKKSYTEDGFEMHMGVNHLGHFLLTNLLLNLLKAASPSRIIVVTSELHKKYKIDKNDLFSDQKYVAFQAYGISKIANILFCKELSKRLEGTKVTINCCHPGTVRTEILKIWKFSFFSIILMIFGKTPMEGAQTQIKLSVDPKLENVSGKYFVECEATEPSSDASNDETAKWLWETSYKLVKLSKNL